MLCKIENINAEFQRVMAVVDSGFCSGLEGEPGKPGRTGVGGEEVGGEEDEDDDCPAGEDASNIIIPKCQNCQKCKVKTNFSFNMLDLNSPLIVLSYENEYCKSRAYT